jgi:hypothetical protein
VFSSFADTLTFDAHPPKCLNVVVVIMLGIQRRTSESHSRIGNGIIHWSNGSTAMQIETNQNNKAHQHKLQYAFHCEFTCNVSHLKKNITPL